MREEGVSLEQRKDCSQSGNCQKRGAGLTSVDGTVGERIGPGVSGTDGVNIRGGSIAG